LTTCATCDVYVCRTGRVDVAPETCPMRVSPDVVNTRAEYSEPAIRAMARHSALVESEGYCQWTRVEETMEYARRLGVRTIGVAFCAGLRQEAKTLHRILEANGFQVVSACCKNGAIGKDFIGVRDEEQVRPGTFEAMCNPIGQAKLLNEGGTGLNVVFGLCVGHDSLFIKHSDAMVTCLVVKDRVLAHNPLGAVNCAYGYFNKAMYQRHRPEEPERTEPSS
jgi:uncharacterized metal-binding protein